jgi:hypothetical protein
VALKAQTGQALYAYLRALIAKPIDYRFLRIKKEQEHTLKMQEQIEKAHREKMIREGFQKFHGQTFLSTQGIYYVFEEESAIKVEFQEKGQWYTRYLPPHQSYRLIEAILAGKLQKIENKKLQKSSATLTDQRSAKLQALRYLKKYTALLK